MFLKSGGMWPEPELGKSQYQCIAFSTVWATRSTLFAQKTSLVQHGSGNHMLHENVRFAFVNLKKKRLNWLNHHVVFLGVAQNAGSPRLHF